MPTKSGKFLSLLLILTILLASAAATIWLTRHPQNARQLVGLESTTAQTRKAVPARDDGASRQNSMVPPSLSSGVVRLNKTQTTAQMSPEMKREFDEASGAEGRETDLASNMSVSTSQISPDVGRAQDKAAGRARDKTLSADEAADAIKADAKKTGVKGAVDADADPATPAPEAAPTHMDQPAPRMEPAATQASKAELRIAIAKAIAQSDSAKRIMRIEDHVAALREDMRYMKKAMATLLDRTAPRKDEPEPADDSDATPEDNTLVESAEKDTEKTSKPTVTKGPSSITSIDYEATGDDTAVVTFNLADGAIPRTRLMTGAEKKWSSAQDWAAIDFYDASIDTDIPDGEGIIRRVKTGDHDSFVRFLFVTSAYRQMLASVEHAPGVVILALKRGAKVKPRNADYGRPKKNHTKAAQNHTQRWTVRAISAGAAVVYDANSGHLVSIQQGSRVPAMGVVTAIHPSSGIIETSGGRIGAGS